ncbi:MAG: monovalent cation/H(+) antiporter subunit G [Steroidobacteraceae bacterium]
MGVTVAVRVLLALALCCAWLGMIAFARLRTPLERMHVVTFVNLTSGSAVVLAVWLADGASARAWKCLLIWAVMLLSGALLAHASGRALLLRERRRQ